MILVLLIHNQMCGIFCYLGKKYTIEQLIEAWRLINHRGPDEHYPPSVVTTYGENKLWFGFHRLKINGLDGVSQQPIICGSGRISLICNGEIYNHHELQKQHNIKCHTHSDCEVIGQLYLKFGMDRTIRMLNGVFGFVLYDRLMGKIYVARDPIGIRPVFIGSNKGELIVASEQKCFEPLGVSSQQLTPGTYQTFNLSGV